MKVFLYLFVSSLCFFNVFLPTNNQKEDNKRQHIQYSVQDDFADNEILVVLNNEESLLFKEYSKKDFKNIGVLKIEDLTKIYTKEKVYNTYIQNPLENQKYIQNFNKILKLTLNQNNKQNVLNKIEIINKFDFVKSVEPNLFIETKLQSSSNPNDPSINEQWAIEKIQLDDAWIMEHGSSEIKVGILDTGIDCDHADLNDNINSSLCHTYENELNFPVLEDHCNHGTPIAGIIGAEGDNGIGISGVCQDITMISVKITNGSKKTLNSDIIDDAIRYAEVENVDILNMSFAGNYNETILNALEDFTGLIVSSSGNNGKNLDIDPSNCYPACYELNNIISVGASNINDNIWSNYDSNGVLVAKSNYGATKVDLFAPGDNIYSTSYDGGYSSFSGTSFVAPYVTGVAALLKSYDSTLTPLEIKQIILSTVDVIPQLDGLCVTGGRLNAYKALESIYHIHDFTDIYSWYDNTRHKAICECGEYKFEGHAVAIGSSVCIRCNGIASGGFVEIQNNDTQLITLNGSYILSNGIIILVEKDIEAYLADTLVFYRKDEEII